MTLTEEKKKTELLPLSFSSLPNEIVENCLARISKWNYPLLSLVSKTFLSLLYSPQLYTTRSRNGNTEPCFYFCLDLPNNPSPKWFTLWMKLPGDGTLTDEDFNEKFIPYNYSLMHLPSHHSPHHHIYYYSTVAVGSEIYLMGALYKSPPSSAVRILDCRSHTWRDGPNMLVAWKCARAVYLDGKIYVMGGCGKEDEWMEVLDIKTQTWRHLSCNGATEIRNELYTKFIVMKGKIYSIADEKDYAYDPKEGKWEVVETHSSIIWINAWCVIEDVMYCYTCSGCCMWFDSKSRVWIEVKGSDFELLREDRSNGLAFRPIVNMLNFGGKLLVMWIPKRSVMEYNGKQKKTLRCAKIALEKRNEGEVWGEIEWENTVFTFPKSADFLSGVVIWV